VTTLALGLVLVAAVAHAGWNFLAKTAQTGGAAFVWLSAAFGCVLLAPAAAVALALSSETIDRTALAFVAGSGALHAGYFVLLQRGYREGDLSLVYPLARGTGPLLATVAAIAFLGERPGGLALAGGAVIVAAVLSLAGGPRRLLASGAGTAAGYAVLTGGFIAAYTLWDKHAVDALGLSPIVYFWGSELGIAVLLGPVALRRRDLVAEAWSRDRREALGVGGLGAVAYVLVLYALSIAPVSYVAPAREVSVLFGAVLGTQLLSEGDRRRRLTCAAAIVAGVVALAIGSG
jgi:drug/metabolite transporter (DMT)-like permease